MILLDQKDSLFFARLLAGWLLGLGRSKAGRSLANWYDTSM